MCYFGSLSEGITQIASGKAGPSGMVTYILVGLTVFFMLAAVTWSTFVVRSASLHTCLWDCELVKGGWGGGEGGFEGMGLKALCWGVSGKVSVPGVTGPRIVGGGGGPQGEHHLESMCFNSPLFFVRFRYLKPACNLTRDPGGQRS